MDYLNGRTLRVATVDLPPFVQLVQDKDERVIEAKGFCFEFLYALMGAFNFSISLAVPKDKAYGSQFENGTWNGMVAMIMNNEADIGIGSFTITTARLTAVDYTIPFYEESSAMLIPAPKRENQQLSVFTQPYQLQVWLFLIAILAILSITMWVQSKFLEKVRLSSERQQNQSVLFAYAVLLTQSGQKIPGNEHSVRLLAIVWCLCSLVFIHAYTGTLMSFLSVPRLKPVLRSLEELPSSGLSWYLWRGSDVEPLFLNSVHGIYGLIGNETRKHPERLTYSIHEAEQSVINGSSVYMNALGFLQFTAQQDFIASGRVCRLSVAKETFNKAYQAFIIPKESPIKKLFNKKMMMMLEMGLGEYWRLKYFSSKDFCGGGSQSYGTSSQKLTFYDVNSAFVIWLIGASLAFAAFIIEISIYLIIYYLKK